jgi:hypothetical protein
MSAESFPRRDSHLSITHLLSQGFKFCLHFSSINHLPCVKPFKNLPDNTKQSTQR